MHCHLTVSGRPWCSWTGTIFGQNTAKDAGVDSCSYTTKAAAERAAKALRPYFRRGLVCVVEGDCPDAPT